MCLPKAPPKDNSAEIAAQREAERVAKINEGRTAIDSAFTGFNDSYYQNAERAYTDFYYPELDRQYQTSLQQLKLRLAGTGNLQSSAGSKILGDLTRDYGSKRTLIANQAIDSANELRGKVASAKSDLYGLNESAADPATVAVQAASRAGTLQAPASYSPLGNAFADFINQATIPIRAEQLGLGPGTGTGIFAPKRDRSAQTIVR